VSDQGTHSEHAVSDKGLKAGAIGLMSTTVIGVASTAPAYSLAASLGLVAAAAAGAVGAQSPAILLVAFVPMLFIASAYYYLNRADPDCGTTFTWVTRAIGPKSGWIAGWSIIIADLVFMPSAGAIAGSYVFQLFGADGLANDKFWVTVLGVAFILLMTWICVIGIELNARTQLGLLIAELLIMFVFAIVAFYQVFVAKDVGTVTPSLSWINPFAIKSTSALADGILVAVFIYWGWDTAVSVNEETSDSRRTPGVAAVLSTVILVGTYVIVAIAAQSVRGPKYLVDNSGDVLSAVGNIVLGTSWGKLLILAVLSSAVATTQTTILPAARSTLAMGAHKAFPEWFAKVDPRHLTPANATWTFGIISVVWYVTLTLVSDNVLAASISAVGLMISFYYALTGWACVIYFRKHLLKDAKAFLMVGVLPAIGAAILTWVFFKSAWDFRQDQGSGMFFGLVSLELGVGLGMLILGIPLMLWWWTRKADFFRLERDPVDARPSPYHGEAPPLGGVRVKEQ